MPQRVRLPDAASLFRPPPPSASTAGGQHEWSGHVPRDAHRVAACSVLTMRCRTTAANQTAAGSDQPSRQCCAPSRPKARAAAARRAAASRDAVLMLSHRRRPTRRRCSHSCAATRRRHASPTAARKARACAAVGQLCARLTHRNVAGATRRRWTWTAWASRGARRRPSDNSRAVPGSVQRTQRAANWSCLRPSRLPRQPAAQHCRPLRSRSSPRCVAEPALRCVAELALRCVCAVRTHTHVAARASLPPHAAMRLGPRAANALLVCLAFSTLGGVAYMSSWRKTRTLTADKRADTFGL